MVSLLAWITAIVGVKPKALCKLLCPGARISQLECANVHLKKRTAKVESDVVRVNEDRTRLEHAQSSGDSRIVLVESDLSPFLLLSESAQRVSDNRVVNLVAKETLLLLLEVVHVDDEKEWRMLGAEDEPQQAADDR